MSIVTRVLWVALWSAAAGAQESRPIQLQPEPTRFLRGEVRLRLPDVPIERDRDFTVPRSQWGEHCVILFRSQAGGMAVRVLDTCWLAGTEFRKEVETQVRARGKRDPKAPALVVEDLRLGQAGTVAVLVRPEIAAARPAGPTDADRFAMALSAFVVLPGRTVVEVDVQFEEPTAERLALARGMLGSVTVHPAEGTLPSRLYVATRETVLPAGFRGFGDSTDPVIYAWHWDVVRQLVPFGQPRPTLFAMHGFAAPPWWMFPLFARLDLVPRGPFWYDATATSTRTFLPWEITARTNLDRDDAQQLLGIRVWAFDQRSFAALCAWPTWLRNAAR